MKDHKEILESLKKAVKQEIRDCKRYNKDLFNEMQTKRAHTYNQIPRLLECRKINLDHQEKYEQVLEILKSIEF